MSTYMFELHIDPVALRKAKIEYNFGLSECSRVKGGLAHNSRISIL